tara:strand:+ start:37 stop:642 length:606 start_codon:yes stop_codon:yes gene_type:complete
MCIIIISLLSATRISAFSMVIVFFIFFFLTQIRQNNENYYFKNFLILVLKSKILFLFCFFIMFFISYVFFGKIEFSLVFLGLNVPGQGLESLVETTNVFGFFNEGQSNYGFYNFKEMIMTTSPLTLLLFAFVFIGNFIFLILGKIKLFEEGMIFYISNILILIISLPIFNFGEPRNYAPLIPMMALSMAFIIYKEIEQNNL